jgi:uncharacterized integral membrane protein
MNAYLLGALFFVIAIGVFVLQNDTQVTVHFLTWMSPSISLAVVVIISASVGAVITFLLDSYRAFKTGQKLRNLINHNRKLEKKIQALQGSKPLSEDKE